MTQRERLIDLLIDGNIDADESGTESRVERCEKVADWLIASGVVVPVRCKECEHHHWEQEPCHGKTVHYCDLLKMRGVEVYKDFFCGLAKRKGGDE